MTSSNEKATIKRPPANALRVEAWRDLPVDKSPAKYLITGDDGETKTITVDKSNRIVLDALLNQPVFCASPVRISHWVCNLRHEYGVPIDREMYENDTATDRPRFGVYFIGEGVERIGKGDDA